jgi:TRIAD3 protein (E3 ubiquitin-protein ligase RNF216)
MAPPDIYRNYEVVDLLSDSGSDDEGLARHELEAFDARSAAEFAHDYPDLDDPIADFRAEFLVVNDHELIDLTNIPDIDVPPSDPIVVEEDTPQPEGQAPEWGEDGTGVTEAACLQMVLSVLPDISVDYVLTLIQEKTTDNTRTMAQCEHLLMELLEGEPYPKESDEAKKKKRKWNDGAEDELSTYEKGERDPEIGGYEHDA